jgi:hypothetical protein
MSSTRPCERSRALPEDAFFWGSFDLAATRFSEHPASRPPGAQRFMQLAEDQENIAVGFWPGNDNYAGVRLGEPAFYAYLFPDPPASRRRRYVRRKPPTARSWASSCSPTRQSGSRRRQV